MRLVLSIFLLCSFFCVAEEKQKSMQQSLEEVQELRKKLEAKTEEKDYDGSLDGWIRQIRRIEDEIKRDQDFEESKQSFKDKMKKGKRPEFEEFLKIIPQDLRYQKPQIENNSYEEWINFWKENELPDYDLETGSESHHHLITDIETFKKVRSKEIKSLKEKLLESEKIIIKALKIIENRPFIFDNKEEITLPNDLGKARNAIQILCDNALIKFREGEHQSAINRVIKAYELANKIENRKGYIIDWLAAKGMKCICYHRAIWILKQNISEDKVKQLKGLLSRNENKVFWKNIYKTELLFSAKMMYSRPENEFELLFTDVSEENITAGLKELNEIPAGKLKNEDKQMILKFLNDILAFKKEGDHYEAFMNYYFKSIPFILEDLSHFPGKEAKKSAEFFDKIKKEKNNLMWEIILTPLQVNAHVIRRNSYYRNYQTAMKVIITSKLYELRRHSTPVNLEAIVRAGLLKKIPLDSWTGQALSVDFKKREISYKGPRKGNTCTIKF